MFEFLSERYTILIPLLLFLIGLYGLLVKKHFMRKLIGMSILQSAVILFYVAGAVREGTTIPVLDASFAPTEYMNPLPHVLMLTAIVVSVATTGVGLALLLSIIRRYKTVEEETLMERVHRGYKP